MTYSRSTRYVIHMDYKDGWTETGAFSRRDDALNRAKEIARTWKKISRVYVKDTRIGEIIFDQAVGE